MERIIRPATPADLPRIHEIYAHARRFMAENGNPTQWVGGYPSAETVQTDLDAGHLYVCQDDGKIHGVFCFFRDIEPDYLQIFEGAWLQDQPYGVVHRIASDAGKRGIAAACLEYAHAQCGDLRIDTHRDNIPMQNLLKKCGFQYCGIIYLRKNGEERLAYQKI